MRQQTLAGFEKYGRTTRRAQFLAEMDRVVPWAELAAVIEPFYSKASPEGGRPPIALERLYDSAAMRSFVGIDRGREPAPDETTVCKFRHRLEKHGLGKKIFAAVR